MFYSKEICNFEGQSLHSFQKSLNFYFLFTTLRV